LLSPLSLCRDFLLFFFPIRLPDCFCRTFETLSLISLIFFDLLSLTSCPDSSFRISFPTQLLPDWNRLILPFDFESLDLSPRSAFVDLPSFCRLVFPDFLPDFCIPTYVSDSHP
jgi:hypothetical protein